jgi:hypothetical protein
MMVDDVDYVTRSRPTVGGEDHASDLFIGNLDDLWANWKTPGAGPQQVNLDGTKPRREPWPVDRHQLLLWLL